MREGKCVDILDGRDRKARGTSHLSEGWEKDSSCDSGQELFTQWMKSKGVISLTLGVSQI